MRGEAERRCMTIVRDAKNLLFFGTTYEDEKTIKRAISTAMENKDLNLFPDYVFEGGFIEHFFVTSSRETRKGSSMAREDSELERKQIKKTNEVLEGVNPDRPEVFITDGDPYWYKGHSYEFFVDSFVNNFEKHVQKAKDYLGNKEHSVFLIEYSDMALTMHRKTPRDLLLERSYGDLIPIENHGYRLSRDADLLKYLFEKKTEVEYVVFVNESPFDNGPMIDVIKSENALEITKLLYDGYDFSCRLIGAQRSDINIIIPDKIVVDDYKT